MPNPNKETTLFIKDPATITRQLDKLKERGLIINDEKKARRTLETINYYRLVHYFSVFLDESGQYKNGICFENAIRLYDFDRKLRTEILVALEEIEIAIRAAVSNYHSVRYGAQGYLRESSFDRRHNHKIFINKIQRMVDQNHDLAFVSHHNKKYDGVFPLWVIMEMFSFGMLVFFFQDMVVEDKKQIADYYYDLDYRYIDNWLENLADLRNRCAHYNRIYGNPIARGENSHLKGLRKIEITSPREYELGTALFDYLLVIKHLHRRDETWGNKFIPVMQALFDEYAEIVQPAVLGFPEDWVEFFRQNSDK